MYYNTVFLEDGSVLDLDSSLEYFENLRYCFFPKGFATPLLTRDRGHRLGTTLFDNHWSLIYTPETRQAKLIRIKESTQDKRNWALCLISYRRFENKRATAKHLTDARVEEGIRFTGLYPDSSLLSCSWLLFSRFRFLFLELSHKPLLFSLVPVVKFQSNDPEW